MKYISLAVISLLLYSCGNNTNSESSIILNDYKIFGLTGNVKKQTVHNYTEIVQKNGKWLTQSIPTSTSITHYNKDGFITLTEIYTYVSGNMILTGKTMQLFENGLPVKTEVYNNDTLTAIQKIQFINDTIYKDFFLDNSGNTIATKTNVLKNNGTLFVTTYVYTDSSNNIQLTSTETKTYDNDGNITTISEKANYTQNGKPIEGLNANQESTTELGVVAKDKKGNIIEALITTESRGEHYSMITKATYEYY